MINNKKGKLATIFIAMLLFFGIITVFYTMYGSLRDNYVEHVNMNLTNTTSGFYEGIESQRNTVLNLQQNMSATVEKEGGISFTEGFVILTGGIWTAMKIPFQVLDTASFVLTRVSNIIGIPPWMITTVIAIIAVLVTFLILKAVFRVDI